MAEKVIIVSDPGIDGAWVYDRGFKIVGFPHAGGVSGI